MEEGRALSVVYTDPGPRAGQPDREEATLGLGDHGPASGFTCEGQAGGCAAGGTGQVRGKTGPTKVTSKDLSPAAG